MNIIQAKSLKHESSVGWAFHYFTGATVALTYPAAFLAIGAPLPSSNLIPGLIWGILTVLLPWLILFPGFGWGAFGTRSPQNVRPLLSPPIEHALYGLGMGAVLTITSPLWQAT